MTKIKICGVTTEEHARAAADAGADFIGLIFAPSRRRVSPPEAREIVRAVKKHGFHGETVGVFVNEAAENIMKVVDEVGLDWVQLSGDEPAAFGRALGRPVIKAVHVGAESAVVLRRRLARLEKELGGHQHLFLLDTRSPEKYGGTGKTFDWEAVKVVVERYPVMVAGGLTPDNVVAALEALHPWGVDVSSGVETEGSKDVSKIRDFIRKVRDHDA
jgi:phosphoribosylanthranilate isomerase